MSIQKFLGYAPGVEKITTSEGDGISTFNLASANAPSPGVVRLTFNNPFLPEDGGGQLIPADLFDPNNYRIHEQINPANLVPIVYVRKISSTVLELWTTRQNAQTYVASVLFPLLDTNGNALVTNTASFSGFTTTFDGATEFHVFTGGLSGMDASALNENIIPDVTAPSVIAMNPAPSSSGIPTTAIIFLTIDDFFGAPSPVTNVNLSSVVIKVNSVVVWQNGASQNGFTVNQSPSGGGYQYSIVPPTLLPESSTVLVEVYATDLEVIPNVLDYNYTFVTTGTGPVLQGQNPAPAAVNVSPLANVILQLVDPESGINAASTVLSVNGTVVWQNQAQQNGFVVTTSNISGGKQYTINPPGILPGGLATIAVVVANAAEFPSTLNTSYTFNVFTDVTPPVVKFLVPSSGTENVDLKQPITFRIADDQGIDVTSIEIYVRGAFVYKGVDDAFQPGWVTNSSKVANAENGFDFVLVPDEAYKWEPGEIIQVLVKVADTSLLLTQKGWFFTVGGEAFPFSVSRFFQQAILLMDRRSPGLMELVATLPGGLDETWQTKIYNRVALLKDLYDPARIPDKWLPWLKSLVGFTRDMSFQATEAELRGIVSNAVSYWKTKPTEVAVGAAIRMLTGNRFNVRNYFDYRMMVIDQIDNPGLIEGTFITELLEDFDPEVIDFPSETPQGSNLKLDAGGTAAQGLFTILDLNPASVFPSGKFQTSSQFIYLQITSFPYNTALEGFHLLETLNPGLTTGKFKDKTPFAAIAGVQTASWRLWGGVGDFLTEIRLVNEPNGFSSVNRVLLKYLLDQIRPASERLDVVYIAFLDQFVEPNNLEQWTVTGSTLPSVPSPGGFALLPVTGAQLVVNKSFASSWSERSVVFKFALQAANSILEFYFLRVDSNNGYFVRVNATTEVVGLYKRTAGVDALLTSATVAAMDVAQVESVRVDVLKAGSDLFLRVKWHNEIVLTHTDTAGVFFTGGVAIKANTGASRVYQTEVMTLPVSIDRVGPSV